MAFWKLVAKKFNGYAKDKLNGYAKNASITTASMILGQGHGWLQNKLGGGRGGHVKFYYDYGGGGSITNVIARSIVHSIGSQLKDDAVGAYKKLIGGKKFDKADFTSQNILNFQYKKQKEEESKYGSMYGERALDEWGNPCYDAVMLGIPTGYGYSTTAKNASNGQTADSGSNFGLHPVWYDTTALVTVSSDKDLVLTRVTGRDYSRKELVSNGDVNFSVSGHITSGIPDVYPSNEVQKFRTMMEYKGILKVDNEVFDQWGVDKIVIKSFSLPPNEGNKSTQDYSFECVGIQPEKDAVVKQDTIMLMDNALSAATEANKGLGWKDILKDQLDVVKDMSVEMVDQGSALATGMLDNAMKW